MIEIVAANPSGNITALLCGAEHLSRVEREAAAIKILNDKTLKAEQAGFVRKPDKNHPLWHLEMAGGEFCGNAARSFGLYAAREEGRHGRGTINITISGAADPLSVNYQFLEQTDGETRAHVSLAMPLPEARKIITCRDARFPLYIFDGIQHLICENTAPDTALFFELKEASEREAGAAGAFGVMFCESGKNPRMWPLVYVRSIDVLNYESSCGSGSAAFACEYFHTMTDGEGLIAIRQPGGVIEARVRKINGHPRALTIGGEIILKPYVAPSFCRL
jgi:diaminopimelate epimerase